MGGKCEYPCWRVTLEGSRWCHIHEPREPLLNESRAEAAGLDAQHLHDKAGQALNELGLGDAAFSDPVLARLLFLAIGGGG